LKSLDNPSCIFYSDLPSKALQKFIFFPIRTLRPTLHTLLDLSL